MLKEMLIEARNDHKTFSKKAAHGLVKCKSEKIEDDMKRASLLRESIDIEGLKKTIADFGHPTTTLEVKVIKSQSTRGPVTVSLQVNKESHDLEEGDSAGFGVNLNGSIIFKFILDDGDERQELTEIEVLVKKIVDEFHYLKAMEKSDLEGKVYKKGKDYEVSIQLMLKLSKYDRMDILTEKQLENEVLLRETNKASEIFKDMLESLNIIFMDNQFQSTLQISKSRDHCCETCIIS